MKAKRTAAGVVAAAVAAGAIAVGGLKSGSTAARTVRCQDWAAAGGVRELGERPVPECLRVLDAIRRTRKP